MKNLILVLLTIFVSNQFVNAQWTSDSAQNTTIYSGTGDQVLTKVGLTSDGGCFISWFDNRGSGYQVRQRKWLSSKTAKIECTGN